MRIRKSMTVVFAVAALAAAGCGGDVAQQVLTNEQLRGEILGVIASHKDLALQTVDRVVSSDTLRAVVVDHLLRNDNVAKQVIVSVATNPEALDMVLGAAMHDSTMRVHVLTLLKGMQMANAK